MENDVSSTAGEAGIAAAAGIQRPHPTAVAGGASGVVGRRVSETESRWAMLEEEPSADKFATLLRLVREVDNKREEMERIELDMYAASAAADVEMRRVGASMYTVVCARAPHEAPLPPLMFETLQKAEMFVALVKQSLVTQPMEELFGCVAIVRGLPPGHASIVSLPRSFFGRGHKDILIQWSNRINEIVRKHEPVYCIRYNTSTTRRRAYYASHDEVSVAFSQVQAQITGLCKGPLPRVSVFAETLADRRKESKYAEDITAYDLGGSVSHDRLMSAITEDCRTRSPHTPVRKASILQDPSDVN